MWVRVDEHFPEHPKVLKAGAILGGPDGCGRVVAVWLEALCYSNRYLTDGFIPEAVARRFRLDRNPLEVLRVMAYQRVGLAMRKVHGRSTEGRTKVIGRSTEGHTKVIGRSGLGRGFQLHDYDHYQFSKVEIEEKRRKERDRKRLSRADRSRTENVSAICPEYRSGTPDPVRTDQDQEQSAARTTTPKPNGQTHENGRTLVRLAHDVIHDRDAGRVAEADVSEELKTRAAIAHLRYDGDRVRKALDSAAVQRRRP